MYSVKLNEFGRAVGGKKLKKSSEIELNSRVFPSYDAALAVHPELKQVQARKEAVFKMADVDAKQPVQRGHAIKAMEAIGYHYNGLPKEACYYCLAYAEEVGISFDQAIAKVLVEHEKSARQDAQRIARKEKIRKEV